MKIRIRFRVGVMALAVSALGPVFPESRRPGAG